MKKDTQIVPVVNMHSLSGAGHMHDGIMAERFAPYLKVHPNLHHAHGHSFYHMVLFTKGAGFHTIDFERFAVVPGQMYFMVPGQVHSWNFEGSTDGYVVNFSEGFFRSFITGHEYPERFKFWSGNAAENVVTLPPPVLKTVLKVLEELVGEVVQKQPYSPEMIRLLLVSLFITIARNQNVSVVENDIVRPNMVLLQNFRKLVNEYYTQYRLPKEYATMLYITPNHLNALCQDLLGKSAGELIRERILLEAKRKLVNANSGIAGIGYELGFEDNSYFTKFFKKYTGITPEEFKKSFQ